MRKISRAQLRPWKTRHLREQQNNLCPLCGLPIDLNIPKEGVVDHNHDTGEIRGVLHRSCNAAEGKIANAAARWGCKSSKYPDIIAYLKRVVAYLEAPGAGVIYPDHKTPEELMTARQVKETKRKAEIKARRELLKRRTS